MTNNELKTKKVIKAGKPGTQKYVREFGNKLLCIRHKYDRARGQKYITAEIIVEATQWTPNECNIPHNKLMDLNVEYKEINLRLLIRNAGGKWNPKEKVWQLAYSEVKALGLEDRIV